MSLYCAPCRMQMRCLKNGVSIDHGFGHLEAGDAWQCEGCKAVVIKAGNVYFDREYLSGPFVTTDEALRDHPQHCAAMSKQFTWREQ